MLSILLVAMTMGSPACDRNADCGIGGTSSETAVEVPTKPVTGERREHAKAWLGDPEQMIKDTLPGKEVGGICTVTQDCPSGFDCVIAGFEGHCVKL